MTWRAWMAGVAVVLGMVVPMRARAACGDGAIDGVEECDDNGTTVVYAAGYTSCTDSGVAMAGGTIACNAATCTVDISACTNDRDGDGHDDVAFGGDDCVDDPAETNATSYYLGAPDTWYDGLDYDCAGNDDYDADGDGDRSDNYSPFATYQGSAEVVAFDANPITDCVDSPIIAGSTNYNGSAADTWYDGLDHDCLGDDDYDQDGDGDRSDAFAAAATFQGPTEVVASGDNPNTDCVDTDTSYNGTASDTWYDGLDHDCADDDDYDQDLDGQVQSTHIGLTTSQAGAVVAGTGALPGTDCVDALSDGGGSYFDGATDTWYDGLDHDCLGDDDYDADGDGFRDENEAPAATVQGSTEVVSIGANPNTDCDDDDFGVNDDAVEVCDGVDNDCDTLVDDDDPGVDTSSEATYYDDVDGDGYGDDASSTQACSQPTDTVTIAGDCDDDDFDIKPGATEVCDDIDNDCDGDIDDADAGLDTSSASAWYPDSDSDGYPDNAAAPQHACDQPTGYLAVAADSDCDDTDATINPGVDEACDLIDNDCDGLIDDDDDNIDLATTTAWYPDGDTDGYPDLEATPVQQCSAPTGHIDATGLSTDCDDSNALRNPGVTEVCDGIDNDCDDAIDADDDSLTGAYTYYADEDGDSYGDPDASTLSCDASPVAGQVDNSDDCDDTTTDVRPGATEVCDGRRNDCSAGSGVPTDEIDLDGDGYVECGFDGSITWQGATSVNVGEDCGPRDPTTYPYASETCDGIYNNCEASAYSATGAPDNETDDDGDGYVECYDGTTTWQSAYFTPSTGVDCNDTDDTVHPAASEICDGQFNDCDDASFDSQDAPDNELDDDGDGYVECRDGSVTWVGDSSISVGADCDDTDADVFPGAVETGVCDGIDTDCDGAVSWSSELDEDGDGYVVCNYSAAAWKGSTEVLGGLDCDDTEAGVYPDAAEVCDGRFNDCNDTFYGVQDAPDDELDDDGDSYVECWDGSTTWSGDATIVAGVDCDDTDVFTFPGASPNEADPDACTTDADEDGWGDASAADPVTAGTDCDDSAADTYPGAPEICEADTARDNDCDGNPNTEDGAPLTTDAGGTIEVYWDDDGDGWGGEGEAPTYVCDRDNLDGVYAYTNSDCDDTNPTVYPGAAEICNGIDDNCNDQVDRLSELDPDLSGCVTMYRDLDEDGYGDSAIEECVCSDESDATGAYDGDDRYVIYDQDCDDTDSNTHPLSCSDGIDNDPDANDGTDADDPDCQAGLDESGVEVEKAYEFIDGNDNDCDGRIAAVELDCDDDGSFALLPFQRSAVLDHTEAGLVSCGDDGDTYTLSCWDTPDVQLECDGATGLWMFRYSDASEDLVAERFDGGRRMWTGTRPCSTTGDCDDQCASRCPDQSETCDGIDNDCSAADLFVQDSTDIAGIPDSMLSTRDVAGTVPAVEQDIDQDGYLACDDFTTSAPQVLSTAASCADIIEDEALLTDCERRCSLSFPGADERCNGFLDDCDGDVEGADVDFDGYRTCGAWSAGGQDEMPEDIVMVVWVAPETDSTSDVDPTDSGAATTTADTSDTTTDTALDTSDDTVSISWTGTHAYVPLILPRAMSLTTDDTDHQALWNTRKSEGDLVFECPDGSIDGNPRRVLYTCDEDLYAALAELIGDTTLQTAICEDDGTALLAPCASDTGSCGVVALTLDANVDADLWSTHVPAADIDPACEDRPEELISRGVWPATRILSARTATVAFECDRLYGVDCEDITAATPLVDGWDVLTDPSDALASDASWWKEVDRFSVDPLLIGTVGWCWGDPTDGVGGIGQRTGGDCADTAGKSHRDAAEGPGDLMGLLDPDGAADCSTCIDGIDNNCDGQIDCADPACAPCFVGQGVGCGGGDEAQCAGAGCTVVGVPLTRGAGRFGWVVLASLLGAAFGRRERR